MTPAELDDAAWAALGVAWALRWALIIGIGSFPAWFSFCYKKVFGKTFGLYTPLKQGCSLVAVTLCITSHNLWLDTYALESGRGDAYVKARCTLEEPMQQADCGVNGIFKISLSTPATAVDITFMAHTRYVLSVYPVL